MKGDTSIKAVALGLMIGLASPVSTALADNQGGHGQHGGHGGKDKGGGHKAFKMGKNGKMEKTIKLAPKGLEWGMSLKAIAELYDKVFDAEFLELYKKVSPGSPEEHALDEELKDKKALLRRTEVSFDDTPTGIDYTALKGEYSYANGESLAYVPLRDGTKRNFFFFNKKLWKIYDEHPIGKNSPLGKDFAEALKVLKMKFKAEPLKIPQDFEKGQVFEEALWMDGDKYIRALNREGEKIIALVYVDKKIQDNLGKLRKNKVEDPHEMDPAVAAALQGAPEAPADQGKGKGKGKQ
jgi:hypothetical protein